jgi:8-oxo-dGTP pyrophosphatase MutT (NUDIX family)
MKPKPWPRRDRRLLADTNIFELTGWTARSPRTGEDREVALIETADWVNVVALTDELDVVLVEQYRHGIDAVTLEIPGGLVDAGESAEEAAVRELREESGFTGHTVTELGVVEPNPAFLDNLCSTYLVENCRRTHDLDLDEGEDIVVRTLPLREIPEAISRGQIRHALVICGFWWLALRRPDLLSLPVPSRPEAP